MLAHDSPCCRSVRICKKRTSIALFNRPDTKSHTPMISKADHVQVIATNSAAHTVGARGKRKLHGLCSGFPLLARITVLSKNNDWLYSTTSERLRMTAKGPSPMSASWVQEQNAIIYVLRGCIKQRNDK